MDYETLVLNTDKADLPLIAALKKIGTELIEIWGRQVTLIEQGVRIEEQTRNGRKFRRLMRYGATLEDKEEKILEELKKRQAS